jgi:hypothetical protein
MRGPAFHLRGNRTYLHATSLFNYVMETYIKDPSVLRDIDFLFHKHTDRNCIVLKDTKGLDPARIVAKYHDAGRDYFFYETDEKIASRMPYDEEALVGQCALRGDTIAVPSSIGPHTFIEKAIAAYKHLLTSLHGERYGKYVFVRIQLERIPDGAFTITFDRIISNRFFQGTIRQNGSLSGRIFFGVRN